MHNNFAYELLVCDGFLCILFLLELFLVLKEVMCISEKRVSFAGVLFKVIINVVIFLVLKRGCESIFKFVSILF